MNIIVNFNSNNVDKNKFCHKFKKLPFHKILNQKSTPPPQCPQSNRTLAVQKFPRKIRIHKADAETGQLLGLPGGIRDSIGRGAVVLCVLPDSYCVAPPAEIAEDRRVGGVYLVELLIR